MKFDLFAEFRGGQLERVGMAVHSFLRYIEKPGTHIPLIPGIPQPMECLIFTLA